MIGSAMHGFMKFGDGGYKSRSRSESNFSRPVVHHPAKEVDKPLTSNVVADEDNGKGCTPDSGAKNIVHVCIPVQTHWSQPSCYR